MFEYISVKEAAVKWRLSERRVQKLCEGNRIEGVMRFGHSWLIPKDAKKPDDLRIKDATRIEVTKSNDKAD